MGKRRGIATALAEHIAMLEEAGEEYQRERPLRARCPQSHKTCFSSAAEAKQARMGLRNRFRTYHCPDCGAYHITKAAYK